MNKKFNLIWIIGLLLILPVVFADVGIDIASSANGGTVKTRGRAGGTDAGLIDDVYGVDQWWTADSLLDYEINFTFTNSNTVANLTATEHCFRGSTYWITCWDINANDWGYSVKYVNNDTNCDVGARRNVTLHCVTNKVKWNGTTWSLAGDIWQEFDIYNETPVVPPDTSPPTINISINNTNPLRNDIINVTARVTDATTNDKCFIQNNVTLPLNTSIKQIAGTTDQCSFAIRLPFTLTTYNFTMFVNDTLGNAGQNSTSVSVNLPSYTCPVGNATSWTWKQINLSSMIKNGSATDWKWKIYSV